MAGAKYPKKGGLGVPAALRSNVVGSRFGGGSSSPDLSHHRIIGSDSAAFFPHRVWNPLGVNAKRLTSMPCCCATAWATSAR